MLLRSEGVLQAFTQGLLDDRIAGTIPMAGGGSVTWFGDEGLLTTSIPVLQMSGTEDSQAVEGMWERTEGLDLTWLQVEGGCHQLFAVGGCQLVPTEEGFHIVSSYALAFARRQVLDDRSDRTLGLLDGSVDFDPRVTLQQR